MSLLNPIYLDYQAATPLHEEVRSAMDPFWSQEYGNPTSVHRLGVQARKALETAREQVASLIHAPDPSSIFFTSDATESANWVIQGVAKSLKNFGNHIVLSNIEHPSLSKSAHSLESYGFQITQVPVNQDGLLNPDAIEQALTDQTILVATHLANHDLGAIQPIEAIRDRVLNRGILWMVDAEAAAGWTPFDVQNLGCHFLTLSPHRFYGPKGVGVLYRHRRGRLDRLIYGGPQEKGFRGGVENVPGIVGAGAAARLATERLALPKSIQNLRETQAYFWNTLQSKIEQVQLNGPQIGPCRMPNLLNISFRNLESEGLALWLDIRGLMVGAGSSCFGKAIKIPPSLQAIGKTPEWSMGNLLISFGWETRREEINQALETIELGVRHFRELASS